jgi:hypothetical protein
MSPSARTTAEGCGPLFPVNEKLKITSLLRLFPKKYPQWSAVVRGDPRGGEICKP